MQTTSLLIIYSGPPSVNFYIRNHVKSIAYLGEMFFLSSIIDTGKTIGYNENIDYRCSW